ncbi:carboxypeptidase-like regulatory domain-containing protein [Calidithermus timidus]|jgi:hypothetical protein|uniref:carboxypeptidase-like regulatory domain-containing protein n=1 Tax=Calidithermus timidus TaxID=307124 RepID=UPI0003A43276|nr:carboxypeptidase-like regulatory domain-containing protein [Calidithermus timidus]
MEMVFWFGGILGALLFLVSLLTLSRNPRVGAVLLLIGLALGSLLIPSLGLWRQGQAYLIVGLAGVGLFLLALFLPSRVRGKMTTMFVGLVLALFLFPALNVAQPWNTNPVALLENPPATATEPQTPPPTQPTLTEPPAPAPQTPAQTPQTSPPTDETSAPEPTMPQERVGVVSSDALCPCLLKVVTGIEGAQVELSRAGLAVDTRSGAEVVFQGLEAGEYTLRIEAAGYQPFEFQLQLRNNRELTVYLLKRQ